MRSSILFAALSASLLLSCSAEEQVIETKASRFNSQDIGKALAEGLGNADFNFSHLFDYATIEEAQIQTHKAIEGITRDAREELAERPDSNRAFIGFSVYAGKAHLSTVCFVNITEGVIRENFIYTGGGIRDYTHMLKSPLSQKLYIQNFYEYNEKLFIGDKDKEGIDNFLKSKLEDPKTKGVAFFVVSVDANDVLILGMP